MSNSSTLTSLPPGLVTRLQALHQDCGDARLTSLLEDHATLLEQRADRSLSKQQVDAFRDRLSTVLMDLYRISQSPAAFGLLYEVNYRIFLAVISSRLRKFYFALDAQDVLQEVFFNIYRYPAKFKADKDQAFRHWASMIIRNTVYKNTREKDREVSHEMQDEEIDSRADRKSSTPLGAAIREESKSFCSEIYQIYLQLYLSAFERLSAREKKALHAVEVEGVPYKVAASRLDIRLENLKMVIFRARKKLARALDQAFRSASAWRPTSVGGSRRRAVSEARGMESAPLESGGRETGFGASRL